MYRLVCFLVFMGAVAANDIVIGHENGKKIYDSNRTASPAIWRRADKITVNATDNEVISGVIITDLRAEKDGEVQIVEGGQGQKNVTFELKSPAVFRGYEFHVEVYSVPEDEIQAEVNTSTELQGAKVPASVAGETHNPEKNLRETRKTETAATATSEASDEKTTFTATTEQGQTLITTQKPEEFFNPIAMSKDININGIPTTSNVDVQSTTEVNVEGSTTADRTTMVGREEELPTDNDVSQFALLKDNYAPSTSQHASTIPPVGYSTHVYKNKYTRID
ncbi:uncharacterized protein LOC114243388 [Bombyx mandarina]|uniref:Uncharacterized protein LOC114243388 n=1 Tax=Bombyx mandarina TaxID=7092 RepID=A0A6J2JNR8_BOMMA|nr:uncharacterized protein LOC114243388 [Bombyx mandarina]